MERRRRDGRLLGERSRREGPADAAVGGGEPSVLATRAGTQFPSDWLRDGSALLVTEQAGANERDILVQPADGSTPWPYAATAANETAARISPDGRWVAYTSDESGRAEVYLDSYPRPGRRVVRLAERRRASRLARRRAGAVLLERAERWWRCELGAVAGDAPPAVGARTVLFRAPYLVGPNTMYDVSPDGERFVIVHSPWTKP